MRAECFPFADTSEKHPKNYFFRKKIELSLERGQGLEIQGKRREKEKREREEKEKREREERKRREKEKRERKERKR